MKLDNGFRIPKSLMWWEPKWSYRRELEAELRQTLNPGTWLRIVAIVGIVTFLVASSLRRTMPDLEFNWIRNLAIAVGLAFAALGLHLAVLFVVPPRVEINSKGIFYQHGGSGRRRQRSDIRRIVVDAKDIDHPVLRVESEGKPFEVAISTDLVPKDLTSFLRHTFPELSVEEQD